MIMLHLCIYNLVYILHGRRKKNNMPRVLTEEHKKAMQEARIKAREERLAKGLPVRITKKMKASRYKNGKLVVQITGKEKNAFDFFNPIRYAYRREGNYCDYQKLLIKITQKDIWENVGLIKRTLGEFVYLEEVGKK